MSVPIVTIDGPSGAGKGTVCRILAQKMGWQYLDSGALYRITAVAALDAGLDLQDGPAVAALTEDMTVRFGLNEEVWLNEVEVNHRLRTETTGMAASKVAALPEVRAALLQFQRDFHQAPGLIADGRDMGTTVFPDAPVKIFLTASAEERAERRYKQLKEKGIDANIAALSEEIAERDRRDSERSVSPLKPADDAFLLDTTGISIEDVVAKAIERTQAVYP